MYSTVTLLGIVMIQEAAAADCSAKLVQVQTGSDATCAGGSIHSWPLGLDADSCHAWSAVDSSGRKHYNSANNITCNADGSFSFTQFANSMNCDSPLGAHWKSYRINDCETDTPPTLHSMGLDFTCCSDPDSPGCKSGVPSVGIEGAEIYLNGELCDPQAGASTGSCKSTIPIDGSAGAVQLAFFHNPAGGVEGEECPSACDSSVKTQWYAIEDRDPGCKSWPGHSGENSMERGTCGEDGSFSYEQHTNCDCSGTANKKTVFPGKCVVDKPPTLCAMLIDSSTCSSAVEV